ncbi:type IV pilus secretin PilQ [Desulfocurvus sp. DL9XJH121]
MQENRPARAARNAVTLLLCLAALAALGCKKETKTDPFLEKWKIMAEQSQGHSPSPPELVEPTDLVAKDVMPLEPERELPGTMVSEFDARNTNIVAALRSLGRAANQSIMVSPGVAGTINVSLRDLPWDQVFKGIVRTHGLAWEWEGDIIRVMTAEDMEKNLKLDQIRFRQPLVTTALKINYADAESLREDFEKLLSKDSEGKARGSVEVVEHTNSLIIHSVKEDVVQIAELVNKLDRPSAQVRLKAYIVETTDDVARDLGIQWGGLYRRTHVTGANNTLAVVPGGINVDKDTGEYTSVLNSNAGGMSGQGYGVNFPGNTVSDTGQGMALGLVYGALNGNVLEVQLRALAEDNKLNILSSPSITTLDNQTAYTENGEEVPFITLDESGNAEVEWKDAVLRLEITPHIVDSLNLKMDIEVKKDEVDFTRQVQGNPVIIKKATKTSLIARNNETVVISGLTRSKSGSGTSGVPGLKDVPGLGWLFKSDSKSDEKEEVLIFITPTILAEWQHGEIQKTMEEVEAEVQAKRDKENGKDEQDR